MRAADFGEAAPEFHGNAVKIPPDCRDAFDENIKQFRSKSKPSILNNHAKKAPREHGKCNHLKCHYEGSNPDGEHTRIGPCEGQRWDGAPESWVCKKCRANNFGFEACANIITHCNTKCLASANKPFLGPESNHTKCPNCSYMGNLSDVAHMNEKGKICEGLLIQVEDTDFDGFM